ncbi:hypothetical protein NQ317_002874 [Molorchus minor]|uniref:DDE-1 domain-containing protein n=1 Tax=Molorchus minor TaxID=1323400 RepID=A0ABQ9ITM4_9CUCU|nr:hypothetical protein NQ317_002874 [Molorchus minor]
MVSKHWVINFCKEHNLSVRTPEKTSIARASGFNRPQVMRFFENLRGLIEKYGFTAKDIYNMDESGMLTVPNKIPKVISSKGKKTVNKVVSGERGQLITAVCCISAAGVYVPPALIFPRKREKPELIDGAPPGTILMISDSGFINGDLFLIWLKHFKSFINCSTNEPILLVLDNHSSHISLAAITFCRRNGIHLLSLPPHSSHRLQPLDVVFFGPLKSAYSQEADKWMISHPGRAITQFQNAFSQTGIWPFNSDIFSDEDFAAADVKDRPEPEEVEEHHIPDEADHNEGSHNPNPENSEVVIELQDNSIAQELSDLAAASQNTDCIVIASYNSQATEDCNKNLNKSENSSTPESKMLPKKKISDSVNKSEECLPSTSNVSDNEESSDRNRVMPNDLFRLPKASEARSTRRQIKKKI